jgi:hypothetical protein
VVVLHLHPPLIVLPQLPLDHWHHLELLDPYLELGFELVWRMVDLAVVEALMEIRILWTCFSTSCLEPSPHLFHQDQLALFKIPKCHQTQRHKTSQHIQRICGRLLMPLCLNYNQVKTFYGFGSKFRIYNFLYQNITFSPKNSKTRYIGFVTG